MQIIILIIFILFIMDIDTKNFYEFQTLSKHQNIIWSLAWNPTEDILISSGADKNIYIWSIKQDTLDAYFPKVI